MLFKSIALMTTLMSVAAPSVAWAQEAQICQIGMNVAANSNLTAAITKQCQPNDVLYINRISDRPTDSIPAMIVAQTCRMDRQIVFTPREVVCTYRGGIRSSAGFAYSSPEAVPK